MSGAGRIAGLPSSLRVHSLRLVPGEEIKSSLLRYAMENDLKAPFIMTCVGSVTKASIRYAAQPTAESKVDLEEKMEICSLVGTLGAGGHLHIVLGREDGSTVSGHVMGNLVVFTTAEIMIGECSDVVFNRTFDERTGFDELSVVKRE
ncbi:uncharacterized protein LOC111696939 [Eurytemora carolleeae]|uniref:uncharacterized protein LOC111696939 n=1 Tax=Eurytemora carolleeae TaxID=1294199 RepID=UPI000C777203|nr:uncharacterized protein LOC111696939 [Eurytemora carolleeae]|eukprot:XP_023322520.1 uncharacterized protein LOC111696939 [Eurytemora affinis]